MRQDQGSRRFTEWVLKHGPDIFMYTCRNTSQLKGLCRSMLRKQIYVNDLEGENEPGGGKMHLYHNQCKKAP